MTTDPSRPAGPPEPAASAAPVPVQATTPARYVIINDCDAPEPRMVCQWVPGVGYCYVDRRGTKPDHDGMLGAGATPVEAFGFVWTDNRDGTVSFYRSERPVTATYRDGAPRRWQHPGDSFEFRQLVAGAVRKKVPADAE